MQLMKTDLYILNICILRLESFSVLAENGSVWKPVANVLYSQLFFKTTYKWHIIHIPVNQNETNENELAKCFQSP